jgi:hypothetical protein
MEIADLLAATRLLTWWLATHCPNDRNGMVLTE